MEIKIKINTSQEAKEASKALQKIAEALNVIEKLSIKKVEKSIEKKKEKKVSQKKEKKATQEKIKAALEISQKLESATQNLLQAIKEK